MQKIDSQYFAGKGSHGNIKVIRSVDYNCPYCGRQVNFSLAWSIPANAPACLYTTSRCSGCGKSPLFVYVNYLVPRNEFGSLYIHPSPQKRKSILNIKTHSNFNDGLKIAYESVLTVYNVGEWIGTATLVRRLLEGITEDLIPDVKNKTLAKRLEELPNHVDLKKPIMTLADALRKGGNLGAHFDSVKVPDKKMATQMMDLLDYLIEYLYILPDRIDDLHDEIEGNNTVQND